MTWCEYSDRINGETDLYLNADNLRHGLARELGFADIDRIENIGRVAERSKLTLAASAVGITAFI